MARRTTKDTMTDTPLYENLRLEFLAKNPPIYIAAIRRRPHWTLKDAETRLMKIAKKKGAQ